MYTLIMKIAPLTIIIINLPSCKFLIATSKWTLAYE